MTTISTPYPEGSILALARAAVTSGTLDQFHTTSAWDLIRRSIQMVPRGMVPRFLDAAERRRRLDGIPRELTAFHPEITEFIRAIANSVPRAQPISSRAMYAAKSRFDRSVSRVMSPETDVFIGMYGAAADSFKAASMVGARTVLNFVNSHPADQNRCLAEMAGLPPSHHEMVPPEIARRVEAELALADFVIVPSRMVAAQVATRGVTPAKIVLAPYGVDLGAFRPARNDLCTTHRVLCLCIGQVAYRKGISQLKEAARTLEGSAIDFLLVGRSVSRQLLIELPRNMRWIPNVGHAEAAELMRVAQLLVVPSLDDAYPLVTLEAMASGLPVVVTDGAGTSELIAEAGAGLVVPAGDVIRLAAAIAQLAADADLRLTLGTRGRQAMEAGRSWADFATTVFSGISVDGASQ